MGDKVINWIWAKMPGLTAWVGSMDETGVAVLALATVLVCVISYNALRLKVNGAFAEAEPYEDWMDAESWRR